MIWTMLWKILLYDAMNNAKNDPIKWWYEWFCANPKMNTITHFSHFIEQCSEWCSNDARTMLGKFQRIQVCSFTLYGTMPWMMLEWCSNDAGQIPKNTITQFHTAWNDAMNDAWTMLERCWENPKEYNYALSHCMERCWNNAKTILGKSQMTAINAHKSHIHIKNNLFITIGKPHYKVLNIIILYSENILYYLNNTSSPLSKNKLM